MDQRIRYRRLERNGGISANSNAALEMAAGEYIALLDHDDLLVPSALWEMALKPLPLSECSSSSALSSRSM